MMTSALLLAALLHPASADPVVDQVIQEAKTHSQVVPLLTELTTKFGARLTSSSAIEKAEKWAVGQFKKFGCVNVHTEVWGEYPIGFDRGKKCFGRMNLPTPRNFEFTSPSWSEGTKGAVKGKAVLNPTTKEELEAHKADLKNAWVIMERSPRRLRPGEEPSDEVKAQIALDQAVDDAGIAGRVYGSRSELCLTAGNYRDKTFEKHPMDRSVTIRKSDMDEVKKAMTDGKPVELEFNLDQKIRKGPVANSNVIAEIKGTEKPDEVVIVSGHFDSWDGPGSVGASDNGTGSCTTLEAARLLCKAGAKPKRTIRFILWSGEEQGLFGSRGYVLNHPDEISKISAVFVDDGGSDYCGGFTGHKDMKPMLEAAFAPVVAAWPDLPMQFKERASQRTQIGSDQDTFNAVGVPGFFDMESSVEKYGAQDYNHIHHTQYDTMQFVIPTYLVQTSAAHACVAWSLANAPTLLPRYPNFEVKMPSAVPGNKHNPPAGQPINPAK